METETKHPWDLAAEKNQTLVVRLLGPIWGVYYPHRKSADCYLTFDDKSVKCCQCEKDIVLENNELGPWIEHIKSHSRKKLVNPVVFIAWQDGQHYVAEEKRLI